MRSPGARACFGDWPGSPAFTIAPGLGLPPDIPGTEAGPLRARQLWWVTTAGMTAGALALLIFTRGQADRRRRGGPSRLPHLYGAPLPHSDAAAAPPALARQFVATATVANFLFWAALAPRQAISTAASGTGLPEPATSGHNSAGPLAGPVWLPWRTASTSMGNGPLTAVVAGDFAQYVAACYRLNCSGRLRGDWQTSWRTGLTSFVKACAVQRRVIGALLMREIQLRWGRRNLGFAWLFCELLIFALPVLAMWSLLRTGIDRGGVPFIAFMWSGYLPILMFRHVTSHSLYAIRSGGGSSIIEI